MYTSRRQINLVPTINSLVAAVVDLLAHALRVQLDLLYLRLQLGLGVHLLDGFWLGLDAPGHPLVLGNSWHLTNMHRKKTRRVTSLSSMRFCTSNWMRRGTSACF